MDVEISGSIEHETDLAYLFHDGQVTAWLPKSQVKWDEDTLTMTMPEWLAIEKDLV